MNQLLGTILTDSASSPLYEKIFEFFADVSSDKFRRQMSSGIGLSLCKSIAESHKGKIFVTSELNTGSTFTFKIPINM